MMLFWVEHGAKGRVVPHCWTLGLTLPERISYGQIVIAEAMEEWRG